MILMGDCVQVMQAIKPNSIDAIVTDPPYGLEFMGKEWDSPWKYNKKQPLSSLYSKTNLPVPSFNSTRNPCCKICQKQKRGKNKCLCEQPQFDDIDKRIEDAQKMQLWHSRWTTEAYRVLKPGGSMLVMGGTRTFHRLMVAIEDSGFILKDTLMWLYGSGFPKAQDLGKMIDKREGAEREAGKLRTDGRGKWELKMQREKGDTGIGHADGSKQVYNETLPKTPLAKQWDGFKVGGIKPAYEPIVWAVKPPEGSYIDNVLKWGVGAVNVDECRIDFISPADKQEQINKNPHTIKANNEIYGDFSMCKEPWEIPKGRFPANIILDESIQNDEWTRFFYTAKASRFERNEGLEGMEGKQVNDGREKLPDIAFQRGKTFRTNTHPTVKPISLFEWLIKLVTRKGQIVLDPFLGSGTSLMACEKSGRKGIGIEKEAEYIEIAKARIKNFSYQKVLEFKD